MGGPNARGVAGAAAQACLDALSRLLPALLPSWKFFDTIGPSPRVDYALLAATQPLADADWHEFRPRPARLGLPQMLLRLCWNPVGNETLYVVRCAERLLEGERGFVEAELRRRLEDALRRGELGPVGSSTQLLAFRVRAVVRGDAAPIEAVAYIAGPEPLAGDDRR